MDLNALLAAAKKDKKDNPYAWVGIITYPINGRAVSTTEHMMGHYHTKREEVVAIMKKEIEEQEDEPKVKKALKLLETHDKVRCGRIILEIVKYPRQIKTTGAEALE